MPLPSTRRLHGRFARTLLVVMGISLAGTARADSTGDWILWDRAPQVRDVRIDILANAGFFGTLHTGASIWLSFPILEDGIPGALNDELSVEIGAYLQYHGSLFSCDNRWFRATPLGGLKWTVYLTRRWRVFAAVKMGASFPFAAENTCNASQTQHVIVDGAGAIGFYWEPTAGIGLRIEMSNFGPAAGLAIAL